MNLLVLSNMKPTAALPTFGVFVGNQVDALEKRQLFSRLSFIGVTSNVKGKVALIRKYSKMLLDLFTQAVFYPRTI